MALDRNAIAPAAQATYIKIGARFGSDDTLRQSDVTLQAVAKHGPLLATHGFGAAETTMLGDARDALTGAGVQRTAAQAGKKTTQAALLDAMKLGKNARLTARSALSSARFQLFNAGDTASVNAIDAVLEKTSTAGADAELLAEQLHALVGLAAKDTIAAKLADAAALTALLNGRIDALTIARKEKQTGHGTPAETEYLDLIDGIVVTLCRLARKAGRAAARELGQPAIAKELQLTELYRTAGHHSAEDPTGPVSAG